MNLRSIWSSRRGLLWLSGGVVLAVLACCAFLRISKPRDVVAYIGMAAECHPVWRQFAFRRFGVGDSAAELLRRYPAAGREEFGRYAIYWFNQGNSNEMTWAGLSVISRDGKLLSADAGSCTWRFQFFHTDDAELNSQRELYWKERFANSERKRMDTLAGHMQDFYSKHVRWPANQGEFSFFVLGNGTHSTNDLGIALVERDDGDMEIVSTEFPQEKRTVTKLKGAKKELQ